MQARYGHGNNESMEIAHSIMQDSHEIQGIFYVFNVYLRRLAIKDLYYKCKSIFYVATE
jgi:hypothetical protein